jgi:predicted transcriptional regulator
MESGVPIMNVEAANTITLTPEQSVQLQELVAKGRFVSAEDALAHSFALLLKETASLPQYTPEAIAHVRSGIQQALRGEFVPEQEVEDFFADWEKELSR